MLRATEASKSNKATAWSRSRQTHSVRQRAETWSIPPHSFFPVFPRSESGYLVYKKEVSDRLHKLHFCSGPLYCSWCDIGRHGDIWFPCLQTVSNGLPGYLMLYSKQLKIAHSGYLSSCGLGFGPNSDKPPAGLSQSCCLSRRRQWRRVCRIQLFTGCEVALRSLLHLPGLPSASGDRGLSSQLYQNKSRNSQ